MPSYVKVLTQWYDTIQNIFDYFQVFLGQKYGYRPIPTIILGKEFQMLREVIKQVPVDVKTLDDWYRQDKNAVPDVYILQPISSILKNFNNKVSLLWIVNLASEIFAS